MDVWVLMRWKRLDEWSAIIGQNFGTRSMIKKKLSNARIVYLQFNRIDQPIGDVHLP